MQHPIQQGDRRQREQSMVDGYASTTKRVPTLDVDDRCRPCAANNFELHNRARFQMRRQLCFWLLCAAADELDFAETRRQRAIASVNLTDGMHREHNGLGFDR